FTCSPWPPFGIASACASIAEKANVNAAAPSKAPRNFVARNFVVTPIPLFLPKSRADRADALPAKLTGSRAPCNVRRSQGDAHGDEEPARAEDHQRRRYRSASRLDAADHGARAQRGRFRRAHRFSPPASLSPRAHAPGAGEIGSWLAARVRSVQHSLHD